MALPAKTGLSKSAAPDLQRAHPLCHPRSGQPVLPQKRLRARPRVSVCAGEKTTPKLSGVNICSLLMNVWAVLNYATRAGDS